MLLEGQSILFFWYVSIQRDFRIPGETVPIPRKPMENPISGDLESSYVIKNTQEPLNLGETTFFWPDQPFLNHHTANFHSALKKLRTLAAKTRPGRVLSPREGLPTSIEADL